MINVLYLNFASTNFDGATYSLMDLIRSVRKWVNPIVLLRSTGCVYDYFKENGVECIVHEFEENLVGIPKKPHQYVRYALDYIPHILRYNRKNRECARSVASQLNGRNIQIVHTNNSVLSVGVQIAKELHAKHVWHLRGFMDLDFGWMPLKGWKSYREEIMESNAVIGITQAVLEHHISPSCPNAYVVFDAVRSEHDTSMLFPKEKYFLFCAGLLSDQKGCSFAIKAFARSGMAAQGYRLRVIGDSNIKYLKKIKRLAENEGISASVDFMGRTHSVREHMEKATAFLMCSEHEGLGRVSIEAMFYGCLVLGRNSGGTKEFVLDGKTGYLFNNIDECASLMHDIDKCDLHKIVQNAQQFACSHFAIEHYGEKIMDIYNHILQ